MMRTRSLRKSVVLALLGMATLVNVQATEAVTWKGWSFDYEVSGNFDGLSLKNVTYQGRTLIHKISLPVVRVFYNNNVCGPYADRLGGTLSPIPWANNATVAQREFTLDGRQWYEIGILDQIGNYSLYQVYYLSSDGILDAHIYSKGLQCVVDHIHYPNWRIDLDVDGPANDLIEHNTGTGFETNATEFDSNAASAANHGWRVRDSASGLYVDILPGFSGFSIPDGSTTAPVTAYSHNTVFGRLYQPTEDTGWTYGPNMQVPYNNGELIQNADIVGWYEAYMPHAAADGSDLWHSTGIRLVPSNMTAACEVSESFASIADNKVVYQLTDTGTTSVTLDTFVLNFPSNYSGIKEIRLGGSSIFKSSSSVPPVDPGVTISTWTNPDVTKRQLSPGAPEKLEIFFTKKWPKANCPNGTCFTGTASFTPGCQVNFGP